MDTKLLASPVMQDYTGMQMIKLYLSTTWIDITK